MSIRSGLFMLRARVAKLMQQARISNDEGNSIRRSQLISFARVATEDIHPRAHWNFQTFRNEAKRGRTGRLVVCSKTERKMSDRKPGRNMNHSHLNWGLFRQQTLLDYAIQRRESLPELKMHRTVGVRIIDSITEPQNANLWAVIISRAPAGKESFSDDYFRVAHPLTQQRQPLIRAVS